MLLTEHHLVILSLKGGCTGSSESTLETSESTLEKCHIAGNPGLWLRVRNENLIFLFLNQHICCGYSKDPSQ